MIMEGKAHSEGNLKFPDHHLDLHTKKFTFGEEARKYLDATQSRQQRDEIVKCVCALLNSGGGVFTAGIENEDYDKTMGLGQDLEKALTYLVASSPFQKFIEHIKCGNKMDFYVKSWCPDSQSAKICSVDSGLLKKSGSTTPSITPKEVLNFITKKCKRKPNKIEGLNHKAKKFYDKEKADLGQILAFGESESVEFKNFTGQDLETRLKEVLAKYVSAFANTKGGYLFIGVDDTTKRVVGCGKGMDAKKIKQMVQNICEKANTQAFHLLHCAKKPDWSVEFKVFKVTKSSKEEPGYIIAFGIPTFCCFVFEEDAKCWHVENGAIVTLKAESWLKKMQLSDPKDTQIKRFKKVLSVKDSPPQCRPVYSTQKISKLQEKMFSVKRRIHVINHSVQKKSFKKCSKLSHKHVDLKSGPGVLIMSTSWAADIHLPQKNGTICEALLISAGSYPTLFSWVERESAELWQNITETAFHLKQKLVNLGGFTGRLCVIPQLVNSQTGELFKKKKTDDAPLYPYSYILGRKDEVVALLQSLTIVLLSFSSPLRDTLGCEFFNLLTKDQFKILKDNSTDKPLFIHGPPGSGKTLIAMEKIRRIKNSDCTNVLYLCENTGLRNFVRRQSICLCETRGSFMTKIKVDFPNVEHIIVDEGQNFRVENGNNWYQKATSLIKGKSGIFWIFLDYYQKSDTGDTGLPSLGGQNNVYLSEVVRNSKAIFRKMSPLIGKIANKSDAEGKKHLKQMRKKLRVSHSFEGKFVRKCKVSSEEKCVVSLIKKRLRKGHSASDIAVIYRDSEDVSEKINMIRDKRLSFQIGKLEDIDHDVVVFGTISEFSGLERDIVIVVSPDTKQEPNKISNNILLSAYTRARIRLYVVELRKVETGTKKVRS